MERFFGSFNLTIEKGPGEYLKSLMARPNPNLAEFAFLCLGKGDTIDEVLAIDEDLRKTTPDKLAPHLKLSSLIPLFAKLDASGRADNFLLFGHSHPIGIKMVEGKYFWIVPDKRLLEPSLDLDLQFFKWLYEEAVNVPYIGILTPLDRRIKMRAYRTQELIRVKKQRELRRVPQVTINL